MWPWWCLWWPGGVHWHDGGGVVTHGVGVDPVGGVFTAETEPPWQPELAKASIASEMPHTFVGALTGAFTVLPDPIEITPPLPLPLPPDPGDPAVVVLLAAPPLQPALAKPRSASAMPQVFTGTLTGAFTVLPDSSDRTPALPLPFPPPEPDPLMVVSLADPPLQPEFEKPSSATETPQMFTGALTGAFTVLPEPIAALPALPFPPLPPPDPEPLTVVLELAPPAQPAFAPPSRATAMPQTFTGALTGAFTSLPDRIDSTPPSPFGPESANATLAGNANPATSTAVPAAAETQRAFFISLLQFRPCGRVCDGWLSSVRPRRRAGLRWRGPRRNHCSCPRRPPR